MHKQNIIDEKIAHFRLFSNNLNIFKYFVSINDLVLYKLMS
jgi:hypothetical protein